MSTLSPALESTSSSYKLTFQDLSRFMDDFFYLFQKGGRNRSLFTQQGGFSPKEAIAGFITWVILIIKLVGIILLIYIIYLLIFKGYPRLLLDSLTLSLFHKENLDSLIRDADLYVSHIKFLASGGIDSRRRGRSAISMYDALYQSSGARGAAQRFIDFANEHYKEKKFDDKYYQALKDYYLFFNKVEEQYFNAKEKKKKQGHEVEYNGKKVKIMYYHFYKLLLTYRIKNGEYSYLNPNGYKKGDDQMLIEIYEQDEKLDFKVRKSIVELKEIMRRLSIHICRMNNNFYKYPIISYLIIPENDDIIDGFANIMSQLGDDYSKIEQRLNEMSYEELPDFIWCIFEYMKGESYDNLQDLVKKTPKDVENDKLRYYLNLPRDQKKIAQTKMFNYENNKKFFEFVNKHPIFSHIYYASDVYNKTVMSCPPLDIELPPEKLLTEEETKAFAYANDGGANDKLKVDADKTPNKAQWGESFVNYNEEIEHFTENVEHDPDDDFSEEEYKKEEHKKLLYEKVKQAFNTFTYDRAKFGNSNSKYVKAYLKNLQINGNNFKKLALAVSYLHLFLNVYQENMTKIYEKQHISIDQFYRELWTPFYDDLMVNRIQAYYIRMGKNMGKSYNDFRKWYKALGKLLNKTIKDTYKAFFTGSGAGQPKKTESSGGPGLSL